MPSAGRRHTALCATAVTATAGRSSCRVSWFMVVCRGSKMGLEGFVLRGRGPTVAPRGAVSKSSLDANKRGGNKKRRSSGSGAQVATRIATKSPEGESGPLGGTSPGHFQRTRLENPESCKLQVRNSASSGVGSRPGFTGMPKWQLRRRGCLSRAGRLYCEMHASGPTRAGPTKVTPAS